jgi:hypothetical protein
VGSKIINIFLTSLEENLGKERALLTSPMIEVGFI